MTTADVTGSHAVVASVSNSVLGGIVTNGRVSGLIKTGMVRGGRVVVGLGVGATGSQPLSDGRQTGSDSGQL